MRVIRLTSCFALVAIACGATCASSASAALLYDNFDSYANTAAFTAVWPVVGALPSGTVATDLFVSSPNSINNVGTATAAAAMRNQRSFAESGLPGAPGSNSLIHFSLEFYESNAASSPARNHSNLQDGTAPGSYGQLIALGQNNNLTSVQDGGNYYMARILGHTPTFLPPTSGTNPAATSGAFFKLNDPGAPLRSTGWHNLAVVISSADFKFYVDGTLSKTIANTGTLRSYDHVRLGSGLSNNNTSVNWDNVNIAVIPEPATIALAGFALAACLAMRRKSA